MFPQPIITFGVKIAMLFFRQHSLKWKSSGNYIISVWKDVEWAWNVTHRILGFASSASMYQVSSFSTFPGEGADRSRGGCTIPRLVPCTGTVSKRCPWVLSEPSCCWPCWLPRSLRVWTLRRNLARRAKGGNGFLPRYACRDRGGGGCYVPWPATARSGRLPGSGRCWIPHRGCGFLPKR